MLWEVEISRISGEHDHEGHRVRDECRAFGFDSVREVSSARSFLIEGQLTSSDIAQAASDLLCDPVTEQYRIRSVPAGEFPEDGLTDTVDVSVLLKFGVTDNEGSSACASLSASGFAVDRVATVRKYRFNSDVAECDLHGATARILANDAIEQAVCGPLTLDTLAVGGSSEFNRITVPVQGMTDDDLKQLSHSGQLSLSQPEMQTIQRYFADLSRDPTDVELESIAQTWSEHCSHKTLGGRIHYQQIEPDGTTTGRSFENMLRETIFAATQQIRERLGPDDWCVSVFEDNAGIVRFDEHRNVCFKVETHNHPSAIEPYGGANTGLGGVIRDPLGTGLGARPVCNTDVFCFASPAVPVDQLHPGVLHPRVVALGVVSGVRDYGNRMGIPTVNGAVFFDDRYLGNPLVFCGNVAMIPADKCRKRMQPGDLIVAVGGRTGRDGIHGATFSSVELTQDSELASSGAVQIGNAITEKMMVDVILQARDRDLFSSITDCGAGGFSSAVGEMGEKTGAEVDLEQAPLKYSGLTYTEIWISEAQERMVLAVPAANWAEFRELCAGEGVEATRIGRFTDSKRLELNYHGRQVGCLDMPFLHDGRPPVVREATYQITSPRQVQLPAKQRYDDDLKSILGSLNVASREWIIRQYDHEVQAGSVVKPLVGTASDGPSDAAVIRPELDSHRGLVISNGMNPRYGDLDPYWMAASAIDEAIRNCIAVGANPDRIAILDNFCWGNTERSEVLGSLVRAALACHDFAIAFGTPFISGKDSLYNEFSYVDKNGQKQTVSIPASLLISALGQVDHIESCVTMDLKEAGNTLMLVGTTHDELGGSHFLLINGLDGGVVPHVDPTMAPAIFRAVHQCIRKGLLRSCHDLSEGGLAVSLAEMAFAGELGVDVDLSSVSADGEIDDAAVLLFSESNTRFVIEVSPDCTDDVAKTFEGLPLFQLGRVTHEDRMRVCGTGDTVLIDCPWSELKDTWKQPLAW